jgi:hypothetical protein
MVDNFFDQFDPASSPTGQSAPGNYFDKFDEIQEAPLSPKQQDESALEQGFIDRYPGVNLAEPDANKFTAQLDAFSKAKGLSPADRQAAFNAWATYQTRQGEIDSSSPLPAKVGSALGDALNVWGRGATVAGPWLDELGGQLSGALHAAGLPGMAASEPATAWLRAQNDRVDTEHPGLSFWGQLATGLSTGGVARNLIKTGGPAEKVLGNVVAPFAGMDPASTMAGRIGQTAGVGALYGTNYAMGSADTPELSDRLQYAPEGAATGIATGLALHGLGSGIKRLIPQLDQTGRSPVQETIDGRLRDIQAFDDLGIQQFPPALGDSGTARFARTLEELPIFGSIVKNPRLTTSNDAQAALRTILDQTGAASSDEEAGQLLQHGLDRQANARIADLPAADLQAQGIAPNVVATRPNGMGQAQTQRLAQASLLRNGAPQTAQTTRGVTVPIARPINNIMQVRRTAAGIPGVPGSALTDAELQQVVRPQVQGPPQANGAPAVAPLASSFAARQEALYEQAQRMLPQFTKANGAANPALVPAHNLRQALRLVDGQVANDISGQTTISGPIADRLRSPQSGNFTVSDLQSLRTEIGRRLGNFAPDAKSLDRSQLKALYGAASRDIENGLIDYANRARTNSTLSPQHASYMAPDVAQRAEGALAAFRRADRYTRLGMATMDRFSTLMNANNPEQAARSVLGMLRQKTSNFGAVRAAFAALNPVERQKLSGYIVGSIGRGRPGQAIPEQGFSFSNWATDWHALGPRGQQFLMSQLEPLQARSLRSFANVADRMKFYEATKNHSGTAYSLLGLGGVSALAGHMSPAGFASALLGVLAPPVAGKILTSPVYLRFLTQSFAQGHAGPGAGRVGSAWNQLRMLAGNDKEFGQHILNGVRSVINTGAPQRLMRGGN